MVEAPDPIGRLFEWLAKVLKHDTGDTIRRLRIERKMTVRQLASEAGINWQYLAKLEAGKDDRCSAVTMAAIANALDVSVDFLMGLSKDMGDAKDMAFYRYYLAAEPEVRDRVRAVAGVLMAEGGAS